MPQGAFSQIASMVVLRVLPWLVTASPSSSTPQAQQRTSSQGSPCISVTSAHAPAASGRQNHQKRLGLQQQARITHWHSCTLFPLQFKRNQGQIVSVLRRHRACPLYLYLFPGVEISDDNNLAVHNPGEIMVAVMSGWSLCLLPEAPSSPGGAGSCNYKVESY